MFHRPTISGIRLDAAGLIALADLKTIARRTALIGSASFLDVLYLSPGIHCQQDASEINGGEYPLTGAMHSAGGWVFRVENPATVSFLQGVGKSGHLTTVRVSKETKEGTLGLFGELLRTEFWASILFLIGVVTSVVVIVLLVTVFRDWWALGVLGMLMGARVLNVCVIKLRQDKHGFKGSKEGNVEGDLLVILSQDRWVRMRGGVDDIKEVTAGQWLREPETLESFAVSFATLLVYCSAALAGNTTTAGSLLLACLLLFSAGILGLANAATHSLHMFGRMVTVEDEPLRYERRLTMVKDMIQETRHTEWALRMSMITEPEVADLKKAIERGRCNNDTYPHVTYCSFQIRKRRQYKRQQEHKTWPRSSIVVPAAIPRFH
ncbi:uncharacterized protein PHACADRAFT_253495 [Phanerochaete carnosa HHB-10118-sp]|uniref:Uncharacterized protein n=1 Tax=Phanerochaete carnosa (strain HHB-10118-sp) TaxID=650164 RepID=K5VXW0_PHACS|nr:uncharacterized protein PHACADRAFT_253495 [Phanerochaete carnosa HHB-10118-sp]EKM56403.1 hypothetical protein PHACADRAFT_253495 [Phanerochaete carnosa HHB-10118-sp]